MMVPALFPFAWYFLGDEDKYERTRTRWSKLDTLAMYVHNFIPQLENTAQENNPSPTGTTHFVSNNFVETKT